MRRKKKFITYLLLTILSFSGLLYTLIFLPPSGNIQLYKTTLPAFYLFLFLLFLFLFSLVTYFFKSLKHGVLLALFVVIYLTFRLNNLTHPFFLVLLSALFLILELMFSRKH